MQSKLFSGIIDDPTDSIFTYGVNGAWESFYDPNFTPLFDTSFINKTIADDAKEVNNTAFSFNLFLTVLEIIISGLWIR